MLETQCKVFSEVTAGQRQDSLTDAQRIAVSHGDGPMMVLAGPGSGKTMVITQRVRELIEGRGISPSHILVVTFTRAAARQMEERFVRMMGGQKGRVTFSTFHSIFFKIIQYAYGYQASNIIREEQKTAYMRELVRHCDLELQDEREFVAGIIAEISMVKGERIDLSHYYSANCPEEVFQKLYQGYQQMMAENRLIDFDDMQVYCYELFQARKDILEAWRSKYPYILVDEFQDICKIQYDILKMLAGPNGNLFIVGDDDQSIYRFRGSKPEIMLGFEKDFPTAKRILLDQNFRCDANIVSASLRLIGCNQVRFPKKIRPARPAGFQVLTRSFPTAREQYRGIAVFLKECQNRGRDLSDTAVLFRTNRNAGGLVRQLMAYNIPFQMRDVTANLYDHWIAQDLITYIRIAQGDLSRGNFLRISNRPNRYITRSVFTETQVTFEQLYRFYEGKDWMEERIERMEYDFRMLAKMAPYAAINYIRKAVGYEGYLEEYAKYRRMKPGELMDVLEEIHENAKDFKSSEEWFRYIEQYGEELKQQRQKQQEIKEGVVLSTIHASKGLEYDTVYIADVNEEIIPHKKAAQPAEIEEERRLFYVAMTRAKNHLYICCPGERYGHRQEPSRFIKAYLPPEASVNKTSTVSSRKTRF